MVCREVCGSTHENDRHRLGAGIPQLVSGAPRNEYRIAWPDFAFLIVDPHQTYAARDEIDFLDDLVMMTTHCLAGQERLLR